MNTRLLPFFFLEVWLKALTVAARNYQVVFIVHDPLSALPISLATRLLGRRTKSILVVHGPMHLEQKWLRRSRVRGLVLGLVLIGIERVVYMLVGKLIAVSEYEMRYLSKMSRVLEKTSLIRNGIDIERFGLRRNPQIRKELHVGSNETLIVNVGHLYTYRGLSHLLESMALARRSEAGPSLRLIVVGGAKGTQVYFSTLEHTKSMGISDRVEFLGDRKDVPEILAGSDIYAERFSRNVDGIGIAIMEAMAAGLPVVTGRDWITSGLLSDGEDCLLVDKENSHAIREAIVLLARDPKLRSRIGRNAQLTAQHVFSAEKMLEQCESEYVVTSSLQPS